MVKLVHVAHKGQCVKRNKIPARHGGTCRQALRTQRQEDLCEFKVRLVYIGSSRTPKTTQRDPVSFEQNKTTTTTKKTAQKNGGKS